MTSEAPRAEYPRSEFSRIERLDTIGDVERSVEIVADAAERVALARRFDLIAIERLTARLTVRRQGSDVRVRGTVSAAVVQACSASGDEIPAIVDEDVDLRFIEPRPASDEIELTDDALDVIEIDGGAIDLGEAAAETMALALDPFPRSPRAAEALTAAGVKNEDDVGTFSALAAGLKAKLGGG